jgi:hypothetical protein
MSIAVNEALMSHESGRPVTLWCWLSLAGLLLGLAVGCSSESPPDPEKGRKEAETLKQMREKERTNKP